MELHTKALFVNDYMFSNLSTMNGRFVQFINFINSKIMDMPIILPLCMFYYFISRNMCIKQILYKDLDSNII